MENLKDFNNFEKTNEQLLTAGFVIGFFITTIGFIVYQTIGRELIVDLRRSINKLKTNKQFRKELFEILSTMTSEQKRKLKKYIKNSVFASWDTETTYFKGGSETSFARDLNLDEEKSELLDIFEGEQREKLQKLLIRMEDEIQYQVMRDNDEWGIGDPDVGFQSKRKLNLRSLNTQSPEDELKVGDNVEILDNFDGGHLKIGSIGKVESISNSIYKSAMSYRVSGVSVDNYQVGHSSWQYYRSSLKKVE